MHDIDRVQPGADEFEAEAGEYRETGEFGHGGPEPPVHEAQELEFASRLLEVSDEQELEQFLGDVFRAAGSAAGRFARSETGRALGGILKDAVGRALPLTGGARGDVAQQAASLLGLELEGLSPPEQEFETARQVVRLAGHAYQHAARAPRQMPPGAAARMAATRAARRYAPGLLRRSGRSGSGYGRSRSSGTRYGYSDGYRPAGGDYLQPGGYGRGDQAGGYGRGDQPGGYWRRDSWQPQRASQWPGYAWSYGAPPYDTGGDAGGYAPDGYAPPVMPEPPPAPADQVLVPAPAAAPAAPAPDPGSSGELGPYGPLDTSPHRPGSRAGRWERRGGVLIVYGI